MAIPSPLTDAERARLPEVLPDWSVVEGRDAIQRTYRFADFSTAWAFMSRGALSAEQLGHHPEWFNVYNRVEVVLTTHDCGGLSELDVALARALDTFARPLVEPAD
ncbi:MAG TPA: 4a-hydroxytetrahydrobiopterin dehydratase [Deltaproteobacteria bacterium]|nr:4a-hydroxytetrahydrobiopterin dehydratase [Deltaproteobacteria bacterium]